MLWPIVCCLCVILPTLYFNLIDSIILLKSIGAFLLGWVCVDIYTEIERKTIDRNQKLFLKKIHHDLICIQEQFGGPNELQKLINEIECELKKLDKLN